MKLFIAFMSAFVGALLLAGIARSASLTSENAPKANMQAHDEDQGDEDHSGHDSHGDAHKGHSNEHEGHGEGEHTDAHEDHGSGEEATTKDVDLANTVDPVTADEITKDSDVTLSHKGFLIHFASEETKAKFTKKPIRYYAKLSLEPSAAGTVTKVDASTYQNSAPPEDCPFCGMAIDLEGDVYILHRGFKIFFGCWGGCHDEFLADPASHYDEYGLEEKDGKLVAKE